MSIEDSHYFRCTVAGAEAKGYDCSTLIKLALEKRGEKHPDGSPKPGRRLATLVRAVQLEMNDEFMGFTEHPVKIGAFRVMANYAFHSDTILEALYRLVEFYGLVSNDIDLQVDTTGEEVVFSVEFRRPDLDPEHYFIQTRMLSTHRFMCWLAGEVIPITSAELSHPYPQEYFEEFKYFLPCQHSFDRDKCRLRFRLADLRIPIAKTLQELEVMVAQEPLDIVNIPNVDDSMERRVRNMMMPTPGNPYINKSLNQVAEAINISPALLRERLKAESSSFRTITENIRRDIACARLRGTPASVDDIAEELGYLEARSFTRAFRSWTGLSPSNYRKQAHNGFKS